MKKTLSVIMSVILALSFVCVASAEGNKPGFGEYEHVFIIGIDGLGATLSQVDSPNFDRIFGDNAYRHDAKTEYITTSGQNWGSILTGVDYETHGFNNDNTDTSQPKRTSDTPNNSIFYYVRQAFPKAKLAAFTHWLNIEHGIIEKDIGVKKVNRWSDPMVEDAIVNYFQMGNAPKLMFVQLDDVDHAAHTYGGFSDEYYEAAKTADTRLGYIYDAIEARGLMEDSLFILVADHGETAGGHGGQTKEESSAVLAVAGHSVNSVVLDANARNRDVAAIALYALGIDIPDHFTAKVPAGLFGKSREKTVEPNPAELPERIEHGFLYSFVRFANLIVGLFDFIEL